MSGVRTALCVGILGLLHGVAATAGETQMDAGVFGTVTIYTPEAKPDSVALFVSGDGGWELGVVSMAHNLVSKNAVVVGIDVRRYLAQLAKPHAGCRSLAVDFENLSHAVQKQLHLAEYHVPVLVGYSSGATLVYATLAQAPPGTFAGALSLGFCKDQDFKQALLCPGTGLRYRRNPKGDYVLAPSAKLREPWIALQGQQDMVCSPKNVDSFVAAVPGATVVKLPKVGHGFGVERNWLPQFLSAYDSILMHERAQFPTLQVPSLEGLPIVETPSSTPSDRMALLLTGDGGWAGLDRELAVGLASNAVAVVGLNSLKYFWKARTPDEAAADVARILRHYLAEWHRGRILLIGYSFGAEVLPFVVNRLPDDLRTRIEAVDLLGPGTAADFEVHVSGWIPGLPEDGTPIAPEIGRLRGIPLLCIHGADEPDSLCSKLPPQSVSSQAVGEGHHFSGDYAQLLAKILAFPPPARRPS
ncbi:MAG TPA: AcvB/VirJ family lysyl-phosphatidylglycerol hydrolase [Steroidobacteraceae bacterium]|jgi:type IV secretory pathway VirJ component|nr:AcvB/VirJ family lysyl-phosphatidylglycerol hydrolase [Steroidobacteraceae bacterium]